MLATYLSDRGLRCTPERILVLDTALDFRAPFTPRQLSEALEGRTDSLKVSRATMFNTLRLLTEAKLLLRTAHDRTVSYDVLRPNVRRQGRQHLVCTGCGKVRRLQAPALDAWIQHQAYRDFVPHADQAVLYVYGECAKCRRKRRKTAE